MTDVLFLVSGLGLLVLGGEIAVSGGVGLARRLKISETIIGIFLIGLGTSLPELLVSVQAAQAGFPDLALGNVVGSNIANLLLILGGVACVFPISSVRNISKYDYCALGLATLTLLILTEADSIARNIGWAMVGGIVFYMLVSFRSAARSLETPPSRMPRRGGALLEFGLCLAGIVALLVGAEFSVRGAVGLASRFGVPESIIGLSLVAVGTSLPELAAGLSAARRKHTELILGTLIGSCIFNILLILGLSIAISPEGLRIASDIARFDRWALLAASLLVAGLVLSTKSVSRRAGGVLLLGYGAYCIVLASRL